MKRIRRQRLTRSFLTLERLTVSNQECAIDFVSDVTAGGKRFRVFSVVDAFTRECLALETDTSMPSRRVTRILQNVISYLAWCVERGIVTRHI